MLLVLVAKNPQVEQLAEGWAVLLAAVVFVAVCPF